MFKHVWRENRLLPDLPESLRAWLLLAFVVLVTRAWIMGNPLVSDDEQFYLMVGDRLALGQLPYADIWDRKPLGIFLIYAAACRVFADPVVGYQLLAGLSVFLTSGILFSIARRRTSFACALAGAAAYPAWLPVFGGIAGQTPVFYNLPVAAAAAMTIALVAQPEGRRLMLKGCGIMGLVGLAIQIKYAAVFEGIFFGLTLLWAGRMRGLSIPRLAVHAAVWIGCALAPTMAALAAYCAMGHGPEFIQANFLSVFHDKHVFLMELARFAALLFGLSPLLLCAWIVWRAVRSGGLVADRVTLWMLAWAGASFAGILVYGGWNDHYILPLLSPFSLVAALAFGHAAKRGLLVALVVGLGLAGGFGRAAAEVKLNGNLREVSQLTQLIRPHLGGGGLYVNEDLPILYRLTQARLPTRYVFPAHLTLANYEDSLGVDQLGELRKVLAQRPAVVVVSTDPHRDTRPDARKLLEDELRAGYRQVGTARVGAAAYAVFARSAVAVTK